MSFLVGTALLAYRPLLAKAETAGCIAKMRGIHTALSAHIQDKGHWPQPPEDLTNSNNENALEDWWIEEMKPFGLQPQDWQCPTAARLMRAAKQKRPRMHYSPTPFDAKPFTPYRWATQPWLIEIGNMHGRGAHIMFNDGSVKVLSDFFPASQKP